MDLKKYLTEGLIQVAILLSLCGMRVDVGLEPSLLSPLHEMMLGPSAGITQTHFHNLWNRLEDGQLSHPKNVDLDVFTSRRLLGLVRSLDRLQVPNTELETWLVHREPDMLPGEHRGQPTPLERAPVRLEEDRAGPALHPGDILRIQGEDVNMEGGELDESPRPLSEWSQSLAWSDRSHQEETHRQVLSDHQMYSDSLDEEEGETGDQVEEEDQEEELASRSGRERRDSVSDRELAQNDEEQPSEEILPAIGGAVDHEYLSAEIGPLLSPLIPSEQPPLDLELQWQDLLAIMEPHGLDVSTWFPSNQDIDGLSGAIQNPLDAAILSNYPSSSNSYNDNQITYQDFHLMEAALPLGDHSCFDMNFYPNDFTSASLTPQFELSGVNPNLPIIPPSHLLVDDEEESDYGLPSPLGDLLEDAMILDEMSLLDLALEESFSQSGEKADSDSGLSLDCSVSPASPCGSESSCYSSSSTSSSSSSSSSEGSPYSEVNDQEDEEGGINLDMELEVTIKQEEEEGAVGGYYSSDVNKIVPSSYQEEKLFNGLPWQEHIGHDHTYNQAWPSTPTSVTGKTSKKQSKYSSRQSRTKSYSRSSPERIAEAKLWNRDDRRARSLKIPFSNELIINLPVDDFNELLANHRLNEQQLNLVRDIRRRGKNKMAAQNCRRRKLGALLGLEVDVSGLRRRRAWLRQEKKEALKSLQEMEQRLEGLYQEVMFSLRDEEGRPLDATDFALQFGANGSVTVTPRRQGTLPRADGKAGKKHRDKKCD
ncbi:unnamed protein product [Lota lota]